jgi:hypothetical protein
VVRGGPQAHGREAPKIEFLTLSEYEAWVAQIDARIKSAMDAALRADYERIFR